MSEFFSNIASSIGINDIFDIIITTFIIYKILGFVRRTRSQQLVKGIILLVLAYLLVNLLHLYTITWIFKSVFTFGIFALIVVFQPELRRALEYVGRSKFGLGRLRTMNTDVAKKVIDEIVEAVDEMSKTRTGALLVFERHIILDDIAETGTIIDANISDQLIGNIFYEGSPLHDGAVIIRGDRLYAAGCVLPLTDNKNLNKSLGTRHRAGIGVTESSDALVIIVSEETGIVSTCEDGNIRRFLDRKSVEKTLLDLYIDDENEQNKGFSFQKLKERLGIRRNKNVK